MPTSLVQGDKAHNVTIYTAADPTAGAVEFAFVAWDAGTAPSSWTAGTWGTWDSVLEQVVAVTPSIGASGDVALAAGRYRVFARWVVGAESAIVEQVMSEPLIVRAG